MDNLKCGASELQQDTYISNYLQPPNHNEIAPNNRCRLQMTSASHYPQIENSSGMMNQPRIIDYAGPICRLSTSPGHYTTSWSTTMLPRTGYHISDPLSPCAYQNSASSTSPYMLPTQRGYYQTFRSHTANQWFQEFNQDPTMRSRPCFTSYQTKELENEFNTCQYITRRRRIEIAYALNLTEKQIKTWFQNRRVKERKVKKPDE